MTLPGDNWTSYYLPLVSNLNVGAWNTYPPITASCPMGKLVTATSPMSKLITGKGPMAKLITGGTPIL